MKRTLLIAGLLMAALTTNGAQYIVTAYCGCAKCCGKAGQPTACGKMPVEGVTCAGPRSMPFGTVLNIPGVGRRVVQDRTARRFDGRIDIYFSSHAAARRFGIRRLDIP